MNEKNTNKVGIRTIENKLFLFHRKVFIMY